MFSFVRFTFLVVLIFTVNNAFALPEGLTTLFTQTYEITTSAVILLVSGIIGIALISFGFGMVISWLNRKPADKKRFLHFKY